MHTHIHFKLLKYTLSIDNGEFDKDKEEINYSICQIDITNRTNLDGSSDMWLSSGRSVHKYKPYFELLKNTLNPLH